MTILINHYALNPADPETRRMLRGEMEEFFFGENALVTQDLTPPNGSPTKGGESPAAAPSKGGEAPEAAPSKGGAAPRRK
jgi:hypothetical protein